MKDNIYLSCFHMNKFVKNSFRADEKGHLIQKPQT